MIGKMEDILVQGSDRIAAIVIFIVSFIGVICNAFIAIYIKRLSLLRNSFGRLLQLQAIGDGIFVSVWAFYFAPVLFFDLKRLQQFSIAARLAQLCLICYDISIYTHLIISINRFISLYFPTSYQTIFTDNFTTLIVFSIVSVSFTFSWYLVYVNCQMGFSISRWMLDYVIPPCHGDHVYFAEYFRGLVIISIFAIVNVFTYIRMHFHNRRKQAASQYETTQQKKRRAVETAFVQQVTLQGLVYVIELVTYFSLAEYYPVPKGPAEVRTSPNRWPNFLLTTFAWISVHTLDGIITLIFNRQFRKVFARSWKSHTTMNMSKTQSRRRRLMETTATLIQNGPTITQISSRNNSAPLAVVSNTSNNTISQFANSSSFNV